MRALAVLLILVFNSSYVHATHLMGGEITWECQGNGNYIFSMKVYRDCNGISFFGGASLTVHNHPTVSSIPLNLIAQNDISPSCGSSGPNITCGGGGTGAVEEFVFISQPITLTGVPPAQGWIFAYDNCCRNGAISNLISPSSKGFTLRAKMFNYNGQNAGPCFDSSPSFSERPSTVVCSGTPFTYNHNAYDKDLDSLVYSWGIPLDSYSGSFTSSNPPAIPFSSGYSSSSPFPSVSQNTNNVGASLNSSTGEISFQSYTQGNFVTCIKVQSYRCGQLVSEVFRELQVVIISCPPNDRPIVTPPFMDVNGNYTEFSDTVMVGDIVNFSYFGYDTSSQELTLSVGGTQFGTNYANPNSGCLYPPCAILGPPPLPTISGYDSVGVYFQWQTSCAHLSSSGACASTSNTYIFLFTIHDDFCPTASYNIGTVSITVVSPPPIESPELRCIRVIEPLGDVQLTWTQPIDTLSSFYSYDVYSSTSLNGTYTLIDSVMNHNVLNYTDVGAGGNTDTIYYYISTRSGCNGVYSSIAQDTLASIFLNVDTVSYGANLNWNTMSTPLLSSTNGWYQIYKNINGGSWFWLDSTLNIFYNDTISSCGDSVAYRIELSDSFGCVSVSNFDGALVSGSVSMSPVNDAGCVSNLVNFILNENLGGDTIQSVLWDFGDGNSSTDANPSYVYLTPGSYSVSTILLSGNGCADTVVSLVSISPLPSLIVSNDTTICYGDTINIAANSSDNVYWNTNVGLSDSLDTIPDAFPLFSASFIAIAYDGNGCQATDTVTVNVQDLPVVQAGSDVTICTNDSVQLFATGAVSYAWVPNLYISDTTSSNVYVKPINSQEYQVFGFDSLGCKNRDTIQVIVNSLPIVDAGIDTAICEFEQVIIGGIIPISGVDSLNWSNSLYLNDTTVLNPIASPTITTEYFLFIRDTNGCINTDSITVIVNTLPSVSMSSDTSMCYGDSVQITATSTASMIWNSEVFLTDSTVPNPVAFPSVSMYFVSTIVDVNNCFNTDSVFVQVYSLPFVSAGGNVALCFGDTSSLFASGANYYTWYPNNMISDTTLASVNVYPNITTDYFVEGIDSLGCKNTDTIQVIVNSLPIVDAGVDTVICEFEQVTIGGFPTALLSDSVSWSPSNGLNDTSVYNPISSPSISTDYFLFVQDTNGCVQRDTVTVIVNVLPTLVVSTDTVICFGDSTLMTANSNATVSWSNQLFISDSTSSSPTAFPDTSTYFYVEAIDVNNCKIADSILVNVNALPQINAGEDFWVCPGDNFMLNASGALIYAWSPSSGLTDTTLANTTGSVADSTVYFLLGINSNGCENKDTLNIYANANVPSDAGLNRVICFGDSVQIGGAPTSTNGTIFSWTPGNVITDSTSSNPFVSPLVDTYFTVFTTNDTCSGMDSVFVQVNPLPTIITSPDTSMCYGDTILINASGGQSYSWSPNQNISDTTVSSPSIYPVASIDYYVLVTDTNLCTFIDTVSIVVNSLPVVVLNLDTTICMGDSIFLLASGGTQFSWSPNEYILGSNLTPSVLVMPDTSTYFVATVTDSNVCTNRDSILIEMYNLPSGSILGDSVLCLGDTILLIGQNGMSYSWQGSNLSSIVGDSVNVWPDSSGAYTLVLTDVNTCRDTVWKNILVNHYPNFTVNMDTSFNCEGMVLEFNVENDGGTFLWDYGDGLNEGTALESHLFSYESDNIVNLTIDKDKCLGSEEIAISVFDIFNYANLIVPNVFTPNYDGKNDRYNLQILNDLRDCAVVNIYNRWGNNVYSSSIIEGWDGTIEGKAAPEGTYFIVVDFAGKSYTSTLSLMR